MRGISLVSSALLLLCGSPLAAGQDVAGTTTPSRHQQLVDGGLHYLVTHGQAEDGSFSSHAGPGVTALVVYAMLRSGRTPDDPAVAKGLQYVESFIRDTGGVHAEQSFYRNYETCLAILCFTEANVDGRYAKAIRGAEAFIKGIQWDEGEGIESSDTEYGGFGYGSHNRPDLSNTSFTIDALRAAGNSENDEAIQRALIFVSRTQNHESHHNNTPHANKIRDGGFYYTPAAGGETKAEVTANGGLRSYASMTYAGLKSMIYAGVDRDDERVQAALKWIRQHYDLQSNPGLGQQGLFYYYHTFAKCLDAMDVGEFIEEDGTAHDWRAELVEELARRQRPDGSWVNDADRWLEGDPNLVTGYVLLALSYCKPAEQ